MKILLLLGLLALSGGSSCLDNNTILPGQVGQITDATVVSCEPYPKNSSSHQCLLLANPYQGSVRVFDMTDNQYVLAPIGYAPLAIRIGVAPQRIASASGRVFSLDPSTHAIYEIPRTFVSPLNASLKMLDYAGDLFVAVADDKNEPWGIISDTGGNLRVESLSGTSGKKLPSGFPRIDKMDLDVTGQRLWFTYEGRLVVTTVANLLVGGTLPAPIDLGTIASITAVVMDGQKLWVARNDKTLSFEDLGTRLGQSLRLEAPGVALYLPQSVPGTPGKCCSGDFSEWVGVLLADGKISYYPIDKSEFGAPQTFDIKAITGIASYAYSNPVKLIGAQLEGFGSDSFGCSRRLYVVYSGTLLGSCEGTGNIKRIDQMDF